MANEQTTQQIPAEPVRIIAAEHREYLQRAEHVLTWLLSERARLEAELAHVLASGQREQDKLTAFIQQHYGLEGAWTIDSAQGAISPAPVAGDR